VICFELMSVTLSRFLGLKKRQFHFEFYVDEVDTASKLKRENVQDKGNDLTACGVSRCSKLEDDCDEDLSIYNPKGVVRFKLEKASIPSQISVQRTSSALYNFTRA
jgi:hypothetical protein